ncbi:MAG: hypothetical protein FD167_1228, partial [bacterium]
FDFATLLLIDKIIINKFANGNNKFLHELGRFSAEYNFNHLPKQLVEQDLINLFKNCSRINALSQNFGQFELEKSSVDSQTGHIILLHRYPLDIPSSFCISTLGYFERLLELLGYYVIKACEITCSPEAGLHRYEIWWQPIPLKIPVPVKTMTDQITLPTLPLPALSGQIKQTSQTQPINQAIKKTQSEGLISSLTLKTQYRHKTLLGILALLILVLGIQHFINPSNTFANVTSDKIYSYQTADTKDVGLSLDAPYLFLRTNNDLSNISIVAEADNHVYFYKTREISSTRVTEISLGEFINTNNQAFNSETMPVKFVVTAKIAGTQKQYSYVNISN